MQQGQVEVASDAAGEISSSELDFGPLEEKDTGSDDGDGCGRLYNEASLQRLLLALKTLTLGRVLSWGELHVDVAHPVKTVDVGAPDVLSP